MNIIIDNSLSRIAQYINTNTPIEIISPYHKDLTQTENEQRYRELKDTIQSMGYGFVEIEIGNKEDDTLIEKSLFIPKIKRQDTIKLSFKYNVNFEITKDIFIYEIVPLSFNEIAYGKKISGKDNLRLKLL